MEGLDEWLPPASAGTETGLQTAQVNTHDGAFVKIAVSVNRGERKADTLLKPRRFESNSTA